MPNSYHEIENIASKGTKTYPCNITPETRLSWNNKELMVTNVQYVGVLFGQNASNTCFPPRFWHIHIQHICHVSFLTLTHIRNLWAVWDGPRRMNCSPAVRITRYSSGTCWPVTPPWWSDYKRTSTPLICTGSPRPWEARSWCRRRYLSSQAPMASQNPPIALSHPTLHRSLLCVNPVDMIFVITKLYLSKSPTWLSDWRSDPTFDLIMKKVYSTLTIVKLLRIQLRTQ